MSVKEKTVVHKVDEGGTQLVKKALRCMVVMGQMDDTITDEDVLGAVVLLKKIDRTQLSGSNSEVNERQGNKLGN